MSNKLFKVVLTIATLIIGVAIASLLIKFKTEAESITSERKLPSVKVIDAKVGTHTFQIQSQGTALPRTTIRLISEVSGKVISVSNKFNTGKVFQKNDVLLTIDPRDYELAVAQAQLKVAQANLRLQMEEKEATVSRREWKLLNNGEPTGLQAREPQLAEARAALSAAKASEEAAQRNLERCKIRAPFDGMVAKANVRSGQFVSLAVQLGEIFSTDVAEIRLPLSARDLRFIDLPDPDKPLELNKGPKVTLTSQSGEDAIEWTGSIVRSEQNVDPVNRMIYVVAKVDDPYLLAKNKGNLLRRGTFLKAIIHGRTEKGIISLPRTALRGKDQVWIANDGKLTYRKVITAYLDKNLAIISQGIESDEKVIVSLLAGVIDGMGVNIQK